jgi:hypothetical protein
MPPPVPKPTLRERLVALVSNLHVLGGAVVAFVGFLVFAVHRLEGVATKDDVEKARAASVEALNRVTAFDVVLDKRVSLTEAAVSGIKDDVKDIKADTSSLRDDMTQLLLKLGVK